MCSRIRTNSKSFTYSLYNFGKGITYISIFSGTVVQQPECHTQYTQGSNQYSRCKYDHLTSSEFSGDLSIYTASNMDLSNFEKDLFVSNCEFLTYFFDKGCFVTFTYSFNGQCGLEWALFKKGHSSPVSSVY